MLYAIKIFTKHDMKFHSYMSHKGRSFWATKAIAEGHAEDFNALYPCLHAVLVDNETDTPV
jgi:alpha-L-arabinofuranosidase